MRAGKLNDAAILQKRREKLELPYDSAIPSLGVYPGEVKNACPHKTLYADVHSSIIYNSQKAEAMQTSMN